MQAAALLLLLPLCFLCADCLGIPSPSTRTSELPSRMSGTPSQAVMTGLDVLASDGFSALKSLGRVGVISNPTGVLSASLTHGVDAMLRAGVPLGAVFGPEHGFRGAAQAGSGGNTTVDPQTNLTVYDIYQRSGADLKEIFVKSGVSALVFDIQDVGTRFYTFIWTLFDSMCAAGIEGSPIRHFIILDRPNPLGGLSMAGPLLQPAFASFVGRVPIPIKHGMTVGELSKLFFDVFCSDFCPISFKSSSFELKVVPMKGAQYNLGLLHTDTVQGWVRDMQWPETGLFWISPSPNMPTYETALLYSGMGLFESVSVSVGRGTTRPFEYIGAPYVSWNVREQLAQESIEGVVFRELYFLPTFDKYVGTTCGGIQIVATSPEKFRPLFTALHVLRKLMTLHPNNVTVTDYFDLLMGENHTRAAIVQGVSIDTITASWQHDLEEFARTRENVLLY